MGKLYEITDEEWGSAVIAADSEEEAGEIWRKRHDISPRDNWFEIEEVKRPVWADLADLAGECLSAFEGEEDSVKQEHGALMDRLRLALADQEGAKTCASSQ